MRYDVPMIDANTHPYFRDVFDHTHIMLERVDSCAKRREPWLNQDAADLDETERVTRKLAAWAAMLAVPTAVASTE